MDELSDRLAERTLALCHVRSPSGEEGALCDQLVAWAKGLCLGPVVRFGNALVLGAPAPGRSAIALVGHLDTVPFFSGDGEPRRGDGRIYGKGASDMKGGIAVAQALYEDLSGPPILILYDREEGPYAENGLEPLFAAGALPRLDLAICLEPTANALQLGCVGSLHATVRFRGKSAHSARPWEGRNAVHAAGPLLARLLALPAVEVERDGLIYREVFSVTRASGGHARNVLPELFELNLNYRFAPGKDLERAQDDVRRLVGDGADIEFTDLSPSGLPCLGNPIVKRLCSVVKGVAPKQAWTDVARFAVHGIDAVNFGPGEPAQAHQVGEWAEVAALGECYRTLRSILEG
jgi:succinyl-diaminopimelate desuccinylase